MVNVIGLVAIGCLTLALLGDIGGYVFGGLFTADTYYLPLRKVFPEPSVPRMEQAVIRIHTGVMQWRAMVDGVIHAVALAAIILLLRNSISDLKSEISN